MGPYTEAQSIYLGRNSVATTSGDAPRPAPPPHRRDDENADIGNENQSTDRSVSEKSSFAEEGNGGRTLTEAALRRQQQDVAPAAPRRRRRRPRDVVGRTNRQHRCWCCCCCCCRGMRWIRIPKQMQSRPRVRPPRLLMIIALSLCTRVSCIPL